MIKSPGLKYNFLGLEDDLSSFSTAKVVILPIPYDQTTSYISGTRKGPHAIINASRYVELYDADIDKDISTIGICTFDEVEPVTSGPEYMYKRVYNICSNIIDRNKYLVMIGGEHSLSIGSAKAHNNKFDNLTVLQFDAHADLRDSYWGTPFSHASVMRRIGEFARTVQVGIRSLCEEENCFIKERESRVFFAKDIVGKTVWIDKLLSVLSDNVYITFDLDVLDPSIMPSVGTPEPGGFLWYEIIDILERVIKEKNIIGLDVVELSPISENIAPDFLAAKLIYKLIGYIFNL